MDQGGLTLTGRRKAAILCVSLGPEGAAEIFKRLSPDVLEQLTVELARTPYVDPDQAAKVWEEVVETAYARGFIAEGGMEYAREVLSRALGPGRADELLGRLASVIEQSPFEFLRGAPPEQIYAFLRNEHPQTMALVLAHLPTTQLAASVLQLLPAEQQAEVATRVALMGQTSPEVVREVGKVMEERLETSLHQEYAEAGGVQHLAQILNATERGIEKNILKALAAENQELAEEVRSLLFIFEDLLRLDDRSIQMVLKEVDAKDLAIALRGASPEVSAKILGNMSQRGSELLREEMEFMPPQRRRVIEEAQAKIVGVVRRLEDSGAIFLSRAGSDEDEVV
jgi:flagellar motor switch protein FliG